MDQPMASTMDQQTASQLGADLFPLPAPGVYDFRERDDMLFAYLSDSGIALVSLRYQ
jgi:clorobiocin/coumermycin A biosynthesis protein CloN6/CouN6